jgi:hypothetical protein
MKITKKQLKQLIKEELLKETDWYNVEKETPAPLSKGAPAAKLDVEALRQVLQDANDAYDPDEPDSVYSVVRGIERALDMLGASPVEEPEEEVPEEEGVVDLRGRTPDIGRLRRKLKHGFEDWRK